MTTRTSGGGTVRRLLCLGLALGVAACGTAYELPAVTAASDAEARSMFAAERSAAGPRPAAPVEAAARFRRVVARVKPAAIRLCSAAAPGAAAGGDLPVGVDTERRDRNAYLTRGGGGRPYIAVTLPLIRDARSDDEIAFVLAHEYGHHIADHLGKGERQAATGALLVGLLTAAGQASATSANPNRDASGNAALMRDMMGAGAALGRRAYSRSYELESDVIATHVATAAGYDPVEGARFFARPEDARTEAGNLSFWGTHPPDAARLATVIETAHAIAAGQPLTARR